MKQIRILSESAPLRKRLYDILYQAGYAAYLAPAHGAAPPDPQRDILIIYAKTRISDILRDAAAAHAAVILLLNPDCYAMYLERARHAGIKLLLMPVTPEALLEAIAESGVIS